MKQEVSPSDTATRSVVRAVQIIRMLGNTSGACTLTQLAQGVGLSKATVSRILHTLVGEGFVEAREKSGPYVIGADFVRIALAARRSNRFVAVQKLETLSEGVMLALRDRTSETVALVMRHGDLRINVAVTLGTHELIAVPKVGAKLPLHLGGPGKLMMAFLDDDERDAVAERAKQPGSPMHAFTCSDACRADFRKIRHAGYATSFGEAVAGQASIAAPVFLGDEVLAVLNLIVPTVRLDDATQAEFLPYLQAAAVNLTALVRDAFDQKAFEWE